MAGEATLPALRVVTYRQLDHWTRQGWLDAGTPGQGHRRLYPPHEVAVAELAAQLVDHGLKPKMAIQAVRNGHFTPLLQILREAGNPSVNPPMPELEPADRAGTAGGQHG